MKKGKFAAVLFIVFFLLAVALICFWLTSKDTAAEPPAADVSGSMEPQIVVVTPNAGGTTGRRQQLRQHRHGDDPDAVLGSHAYPDADAHSYAHSHPRADSGSLTSFSIPAASLPTRVCR